MLTIAQKPFEFFGGVKRQAGLTACRTAFYNWLLSKGQTPSQLNVKLTDPWPGQADIGRLMNHGVMMQQGMSLKIDDKFWSNTDSNQAWREIVHSFVWLRDLRASGGDASRKVARQLAEEWMARYDRWDATIWRPDIMGQRMAMWISFYDFFCASADENFQKAYFSSLNRQARHLARIISTTSQLSGVPLLKAAEGLIYAGLALSEEDNWTLRGFEIILREIPKQIRKDGSHVSGSPENILQCAQILLDLRYALNRAHLPIPKAIQHALERMGTALRFFTYPDKKLALFHGSQEAIAETIETTLSQIRTLKRGGKETVLGGFEKISQGKSVLLLDTNSVPESPYSKRFHSAPLAFEFVFGRDRIFTNCGGHAFNQDWQQGLRHTAAHNSLTLSGKPVHEFLPTGEIIRSHSPICSVRRETKEACLIDVSHDAFRATHGIDHKRRFFLSAQGQDLRGEDTLLSRVSLAKPVEVCVRFHLHPRVEISSVEENGDIFMTLPGGTTWKFSCVGAESTIDTSVFLGNGVKPLKTRQILLTTEMSSDAKQIKWALQRV